MKICIEEKRIGVLSLAVSSALVVMFATPMMAYAADASDTLEDEVAVIRRPTNYIEVGAENVSKDSAKFGEYNGLNKSGGKVISNISVRGGNAYEGGDGTRRWSIKGSNLGTTSRELGATVGNQGSWNLYIGHDELRHNITDTYQTPLQGNMGGNVFTLPDNFGSFNAAAAPSARSLTPAQLGAFHTEDVGTTRKNTSLGVGINISPELSLKFDYNHLAQSGAKLIAGAATGGVAATTGTWRAEAVAILMNPTNYKTDSFKLALNWVGEQGHLSGGYYGSIFQDGYDRLSWQNPMLSTASTAAPGLYQTNTMSTAPDNQLHQLNLSGGYAFSPATKLVGGVSYGRNTQNAGFLTGMPEIVLAPQGSLNGLVVTKHADMKLTNQTTKELMLSATLKHNERDNQTASNVYQYWAINSIVAQPNPALAGYNMVDAAANAPYSNKKSEFGLAGDYRLDKSQTIRLAYDYEKNSRWCSSYAFASNCLVSPSSSENRLGIKYKLKVSNDVSMNAGYSHANRKGTFDHNAITPLAGLNSLTPTDVNAQDYPGFVAVSYASRKQDMLKAGVNWQASEKLELGVNGRYARDNYYESTLGVQGSRTTGINLDTTYSYSDDASVSAYVSWRNSKKDMRIGNSAVVTDNTQPNYSLLVAPTNIWTNKLAEDGRAIGLNTKQRLMASKLELVTNLSYSIDKSHYSTQVPYLPTCSAATALTCGDLPDIKSRVITLRIGGIYALDQVSKISVGYMFQQLKSVDYFYNWYQYGNTGLRGMPTNQQSGSYNVNVVSVSYIYNFK